MNPKTSARISVSMPQAYVEKLDRLIEKGLYLDKGQIIREGIRRIFKSYDMFYPTNEGES